MTKYYVIRAGHVRVQRAQHFSIAELQRGTQSHLFFVQYLPAGSAEEIVKYKQRGARGPANYVLAGHSQILGFSDSEILGMAGGISVCRLVGTGEFTIMCEFQALLPTVLPCSYWGLLLLLPFIRHS